MKLSLIILTVTLLFPPDPLAVKVVGTVTDSDYNYTTILVEQVVEYGRGIKATPEEGKSITVRLPAREKPAMHTRIEASLQESISVGSSNSAYIMVEFETVE